MGLGMQRADYDALFGQAVKEYPDYWYYYPTRAIFLLPRWYGEPGDWEKDLTQSANRIGGDDGDMIYAQVVCATHHYGGGVNVFEGNIISWERVEKGLELLLKKFPESLNIKNERALLAAVAGDREKARTYFAQIKDQCDLAVWRDKKRLEDFIAWMKK